ncbi:MAG: Gfo/Idh/MocA family oxidoreductase, partial [Patescibacteria group bacterium]|nr:Gfo/Idh/MocA family oxidoreductase [Patescibacteria group bacterium]
PTRRHEGTPMTDKLRMAVIGAGRLGRFHAQKIAQAEHARLVAVVDPVCSNRERVAAECHCEGLSDYADLLHRIDAAVIASPTRWHHAIAMELVERGIHVLVEKPICATLVEAEELVDAARRRGVVLQVGHVERFNPAFSDALPQMAAPKYIDVLRASPFTFRSTDVGVVLDLMIHDLDLVLSLARSPLYRVHAVGASVVGQHEDVANARLEFENGCVATLSASRVSYAATRRMHVWTAESFSAIDFATRSLCTVRPSETLRRGEFDLDALAPTEVEYWQKHFAEEHLPCSTQTFDAVDALALECADFISAIRTGHSPRVPGEAGRDALGLAEQVLDSLSRHAWNDRADGRMSPSIAPPRTIIPAPHFTLPHDAPLRKAAG